MSTDTNHASTALHAVAAGLSNRRDDSLVDFRIKCGYREWNVHGVILAMHSRVLGAACTREFKEARDGVIDLSEEDERCIDALVLYLYKLDYDSNVTEGSDFNVLEFHVKMCILADKYDITPLKLQAAEYFKADSNKISGMTDELCEAAVRAYQTPQPTQQIREHIVTLALDRDALRPGSKSGFQRLMRDCAELATDVALALRVRSGCSAEQRWYQCPGCDSVFVIPETGEIGPTEALDASFWCYSCGSCYPGDRWEEDCRI